MKKFISLALVLMMILSLTTVAFAANDADVTCEITAPDNGHSYEAYQIFTGDLYEGVLSNIVWGNGISAEGQAEIGLRYAKAAIPEGQETPSDLKAFTAPEVAAVLKTETDGEAFAEYIAPYLVKENAINLTAEENKHKPDDTLNASHFTTKVDPGYYLVKDSEKVTGHDAATDYILHVAGDIVLHPKSSVPTVDKTQSTTGVENSFTHDVLDVNIGDKVYYELSGTMPNTLDDYASYKYVFHDKLSAGLTFNNDVTVFIDGVKVKADSYEVTAPVEGSELTVSFANVLAAKDAEGNKIAVTTNSEVKVYYTATLNVNAVIGGNGNPNAVYLEFSNNPTYGGEGDTGTTPEVKVVVFTFQINVDKQDNADKNTHLKDAKFILLNADKSKAVILDANGKVSGWADATHYEGDTCESHDETIVLPTTIVSDENGLFKFVGLDAGEYYLKETKAPAGYSKLDADVQLKIIPTYDHTKQELTGLKADVDKVQVAGKTDDGSISIVVRNSRGSSLPSTGGMGTTLFYLAGTVMVMFAGVALVTKKRVSR